MATRKIPCWTSREKWLIAFNIALLSPAGEALRRKYEVSVKACMAAARTEAFTADSATGRNVQTSHKTGVRKMGLMFGLVRSVRTYRKVRDIIRLLGFGVVIDEGRYLTKTERLQAALLAKPNSRRWSPQIRKASTRVLTMARIAVQEIGHLPRRGSTCSQQDLSSTHQKRAKARRPGKQGSIPGLPLQRLAAHLVREATFLRSVHARTICRALEAAGISPDWWTAHEVATVMYSAVIERRWTAPVLMTNPAGYLRFLLSMITREQIGAHIRRKRKAIADRQARLASAYAATARAQAAGR